jgi:hypothetical protein
MESFQNFRKLWGRIESDLAPGKYKMIVKNCKQNFYFSLQCDCFWS